MANWTLASKVGAQQVTGAAAASSDNKKGKGKKDKPNPNQPSSKPKAEKKVKEAVVYEADTTVLGEKKDTSKPMLPEYVPKNVEAAWYQWWEKKGFFHANPENVISGKKKPFTMVIPPPNVTGALHLGHALMLSIEDVITRTKRMQGYETLWLPGCDHAGIATQSVVEKQLWKNEKKTRHDFPRDVFVQKVWDWKDEYGGKINN